MPAQLSKKAPRAVALLSTPHPKHSHRNYTVSEAAKKTGVARTTIYRHMAKLGGK